MFDGVLDENTDAFRAFAQWSAFPKGILEEFETCETGEDEEPSPQLQEMPQFLGMYLDDGWRRSQGIPTLGELRNRGQLNGSVPKTMDEMAAILDVGRRTLYNWRDLDAFGAYSEQFVTDYAGQARQRIKVRSLHEAENRGEAMKEREMWLKTFGDVSDEKTINVSGEIHHTHEEMHTVSEEKLLNYALQELRQDKEIQNLPLPVVKTMLNKIARMVMGQGLSQEVLAQVDQDALRTPEEINEHGGRDFLLGDGDEK